MLNFLTAGLGHKDLASVAATSIQNICSQCQDHMKDHCEGLLQIAQAMDAFNLTDEAAVGIIKGKVSCCIIIRGVQLLTSWSTSLRTNVNLVLNLRHCDGSSYKLSRGYG